MKKSLCCVRRKIITVIKNSFAVTLYLMSCLVFTCICFMPDDSLQVYRGAGLAGSQVLWLSQGGGICGGPDINLENKILIAGDGEGKLEAPVLLLDKSLD